MADRTGADASQAEGPLVRVLAVGEGVRVVLAGSLGIGTVSRLDRELSALPVDRLVQVDFADVTHLDTAGAWAVCRLRQRAEAAGQSVDLSGLGPGHADLIAAVCRSAAPLVEPDRRRTGPRDMIEAAGRATVGAGRFVVELTAYLGLFFARLARFVVNPRSFRPTALVHHCQDVGLSAVPIVALMAFLIGIVLAFQGAAQLRQFGAEIFVVDLIAISILRELGILLTAIIVAGRTASAFTAAIGSMKMREEIDAMRTLGLNPADELIMPRVLALLVMLPILGLIANLMGLLGGALMSWIELGISPALFRIRLAETHIAHLAVGMVKAPVFALIIGIVGCHAGMRVGGDTESLGRMTSASVVTAIFMVIVADAAFSILFASTGL